MKIKDIVKKYNLPKNMYYDKLGDGFFASDFIIINKGEFLFFIDDRVSYMNGSLIAGPIPESEIENYLLRSKQYIKILRKKKLKEINDK